MSDKLREALNACTVSCTGTEITIQCNDHDVKDAIFDGLEALAQPQNDAEANLEDAVTPTIFLSLADKDVVKATDCRLVAKRLLSEVTAPPSPERMREAVEEALAENKALRAANTKLVLAERDRLEALRAGDNHAIDGKSNPVLGAESASGAHVADRTAGANPATGANHASGGKESECGVTPKKPFNETFSAETVLMGSFFPSEPTPPDRGDKS